MKRCIQQSFRSLRADDRGQAMTESTILMMFEAVVALFLLSMANPMYEALRIHYEWFNFLYQWPIP